MRQKTAACAARVVCALMAGFLATGATAQVEVDTGEILSEIDLRNRSFMGQGFTLAPGTTFDINDGGILNGLGAINALGDLIPFDFGGSTVNINSGGLFESRRFFTLIGPTVVTNAEINVFDGGTVGSTFTATSGTAVNIFGGVIGPGFIAEDGSEITIAGGTVGAAFDARSGSTVSISNGSIGGISPPRRAARSRLRAGAWAGGSSLSGAATWSCGVGASGSRSSLRRTAALSSSAATSNSTAGRLIVCPAGSAPTTYSRAC